VHHETSRCMVVSCSGAVDGSGDGNPTPGLGIRRGSACPWVASSAARVPVRSHPLYSSSPPLGVALVQTSVGHHGAGFAFAGVVGTTMSQAPLYGCVRRCLFGRLEKTAGCHWIQVQRLRIDAFGDLIRVVERIEWSILDHVPLDTGRRSGILWSRARTGSLYGPI
jgi:hypothetical protein